MKTSAIISSALLAIAVSGAPVDLPKLPVSLPNLALGSLPTGLPALPAKIPTEFPATLPSGLPTGLPSIPKEPTNDVELPVVKLPVRRADLPVVDDALKGLKIPALPKVPVVPNLPVGDSKLPVKRAELPVINNLVEDVKIPNIATLPTLPKVPIDNVNLPVRRTVNVNAPVALAFDDLVELPDVNIHQPTVAVPAIPTVDLPIVPTLPKVARDIKQSLPVVEGVNVPLDAGKIQVGTVDKYVDEVVKGTTLNDIPIEQIVKGATVKDLPEFSSRDIKQSLPVVGVIDVPLDAGKIQVGTVDKYVEDVVKGTTIGL